MKSAFSRKSHNPVILLVDGCSASGKSSFKKALMEDGRFSFSYVKRYTTRAPRPDDADNDDYYFVSAPDFEKMIKLGQLAEYRHYLFGMAYGLKRDEIVEAAAGGKNVLGLMNLGAIGMVRNSLPEAVAVIIDAPLNAIESRLRARGYHSEEQIEERLDNARSVQNFKNEYDFICSNEDGKFEQAYNSLVAYLEGL